MRRIRLYQVISLTIFAVVMLLSIILAIFKFSQISIALLLIGFPMAIIVTVFGSLAIREEEEEKS